MNTLFLLIDERWPETPAADWVLCGPRGAVLQQGRSEPRHWPPAERRVAVLAGAQVALCAIALPRHRRADRDRLIAYAVEERIPVDPERQHFTLLDQQGEQGLIAMVDAGRLRQLVDSLAALKLPLAGLYGRLQGLPRLDRAAVGVDEDRLRYWRWPDGAGLVEDLAADGAPSALARRAVQQSGVEALLGAPALAEALGLPLAAASAVAPWYVLAGQSNLLHGDFSPRGSGPGLAAGLRWPLRIVAGALALYLVVGLFGVMKARQDELATHARVKAIFESAFPGAAMVDPVLQMRRQLNEQRPRHGALRDDDLLALLAPLAEVLGTESRAAITRLQFEGGALEVTLRAPLEGARRQALIDGLAMRGIRVRAGTGDAVFNLRRSEA